MAKDECIKFPAGSYQALHEGVCYKIDPEKDVVEMTQKLNFKYSPESKEETFNLFNKLGAKEVQKRASLFSILLIISILLFIFLTIIQAQSAEKFQSYLSAGKFLTVTSEVAFLYMFAHYRVITNYYKDSYCKNCGKYLVFEEYQAPLLKEESKVDSYTKTLKKHWRCKNCGYEDIRIEPNPVNHRYEKSQRRKECTCTECGKEHALEEYRNADVLTHASKKRIRYFKCKYCGYHEIRLHRKIKYYR